MRTLANWFNPSTTGWDADSTQSNQYINDQASDGAWRLTIGDAGDLFQLTSQVIQTGDGFTLEFDAAAFGGLLVFAAITQVVIQGA